ncbi:hypothetical protein DFP72DRAFT_1064817 [Ephemerocybe angulata]|uniref:DUF6533 domain-containing protein n=1 Tax=Ephemerocybe angulata TaxID=980116 RepID=A0A8H6I6B3_9AGAR|nr:hypothetical protein DFP72DRAFT_1064817 [Tulosesus angulatus]
MSDSADSAALFAQLIEVGAAQQVLKYLFISFLTLAIADTLHCLPLEVSLIWSAKWNMGKVLFLLSRYLVFFDVIVSLSYNFAPNLSVVQCGRLFAAGSSLTVVGVTVAEAILFLRVYALGGRGRIWGASLGALYLAIHSAVFAALIKFIISIEYAPSPLPSLFACLPVKGENKMLSIVFILILISELVILGLTFWLCLTDHKESKSPLVATFSRDGLFYFLLLSAVSCGNIICNLAAPTAYIYLLTIPQRVLHSVLSTRMVLHIRSVGGGVYDASGEIPLTTFDRSRSEPIRFAVKVQKEEITDWGKSQATAY